jgi:hypothetical protein
MATIKLQPSGKVVIKDGKVACACCAVACCPYPAQALVDGLYSVDDLPDAITALCLTGETGQLVFNKSGSSYFASGDYPWKYEIWLDPANNALWLFYRFEDGEWRPIQVEGQGPCLIFDQEDCGVKDQFADSYLLTSSGAFFPETVTRIDLCNWTYEYPEPCVGAIARLQLVSFQGAYLKWSCIIDKSVCGGYLEFGFKDGPQNSPVGNYLDNFGDLVFTVS